MLDRPDNSAEIRGERPEHVVLDSRGDCPQGGDDRFLTSRRFVAETYNEGNAELHLHFRLGFPAEEFCAVVHRSEKCVADGHGSALIDDFGAGLGRADEVECSVLVDVAKLMQNPERVRQVVGVPSVMRLQSLDDCLSVWVDAPNFVRDFLKSRSAIAEDRGRRFSDVAREALRAYVDGTTDSARYDAILAAIAKKVGVDF